MPESFLLNTGTASYGRLRPNRENDRSHSDAKTTSSFYLAFPAMQRDGDWRKIAELPGQRGTEEIAAKRHRRIVRFFPAISSGPVGFGSNDPDQNQLLPLVLTGEGETR